MAGNNCMHAKCANTGTAELRAFLAHVQELDDQALEVMKATKAAEARLAQRAEQLAAIRSDFERKQKEVRAAPAAVQAWRLIPHKHKTSPQ